MSQERSTVEVLKAARERISDRRQWTQRKFARDRRSKGCAVTSERACKWCAVGAVGAAGGDPGLGSPYRQLLDEAARAVTGLPFATATDLNDGLSTGTGRAAAHAQVLEMYDRAIELAEATK